MNVVIMLAVHNQQETLSACIESIMNQTWKDWLLCIVDDGSTDGSYDIAKSWRTHPQVHLMRNFRRMGLAASLNRIWRTHRADLYARIDADDTCLPDRLAIQCAFMARHPEIAVLGGGAQVITEDGVVMGSYFLPVCHEQLAADILRRNPFIHPTVMMRREFLDELGGYDERMRRAQDYDLWLRGVDKFRYHNLPTPLIRYRVASKPSWSSMFWGAVVLIRTIRRRRLGWLAYQYPLRFVVGSALVHWGLRPHAMLRVPKLRQFPTRASRAA